LERTRTTMSLLVVCSLVLIPGRPGSSRPSPGAAKCISVGERHLPQPPLFRSGTPD
jgi:hypothetical protein